MAYSPSFPMERLGADPVLIAIQSGERCVTTTAHDVVQEFDVGQVLATDWLDIEPPLAGTTAAAHTATRKAGLVQLYVPLARLVSASVAARVDWDQ